QRRVAAGADHDAGGILVQGQQRERAVQAGDDGAHGFGQVAAALVFEAHQDGGDFGVGFAGEGGFRVRGEQFVFEFGEVLDDAVVDEGKAAVVAEVRVGVLVGGSAVRGPAGVADA